MELRYLHPKINRLFDSFQLNLGIKRFLYLLTNPHYVSWLTSFDDKIVYPIYKLLNDYLTTRTIYHYGADYRWGDIKSHNLDIDRFNLGYGLIHHAIIRNQKPKRVLCVGSMYGFVPFMMAKACMENGEGHVDFVDAGYDMKTQKDVKRHYYGQGFWKTVNPKKHFSYLLSPKFITTYIMASGEFAKKYKYKYDYIYLDGDHSYKGALRDFKLFWPRLKKDGYFCLHDIHFKRIEEGLPFEHWKLWNQLVKKMPYKFELSNDYSGLGFIQKRGDEKI